MLFRPSLSTRLCGGESGFRLDYAESNAGYAPVEFLIEEGVNAVVHDLGSLTKPSSKTLQLTVSSTTPYETHLCINESRRVRNGNQACAEPLSVILEEMTQSSEGEDRKHDKAVDMTFPASDATAHGPPTSTEPPCRPIDRKVPIITREQVEQAQRGEGHQHQERKS